MLGWGEAAGEGRKSADDWVSSAPGKFFISVPGQLITLSDQDAGPSWGSSGVYVQPLKAEAHSPRWARPPPGPTALKLCECPPMQWCPSRHPRKWPLSLQISGKQQLPDILSDTTLIYGLFSHTATLIVGLSRWPRGKKPDCQCRRRRFNPWLGKISWRRKQQPTPVSLPGKSYGQRSLVVYSHELAAKQ